MGSARPLFQAPYLAAFFFLAAGLAAALGVLSAGAGVVAGFARRGAVRRSRGASPVTAPPFLPPFDPPLPARASSSSIACSSVIFSGSTSVGSVALTPLWLT